MAHIYNGIILSHKKRWNTAICNNMDGSWEHYAKWNVNQKKLRTIWVHSYVGYKTETHRHRQQCGGYQRKGVGGVKGKGGQIYGDGRQLDLGWRARDAMYTSCIM